MTVVQALEGVQEEEVVGALLQLRSALERPRPERGDPGWSSGSWRPQRSSW